MWLQDVELALTTILNISNLSNNSLRLEP